MTYYDEKLRVLQERVQRKSHLEPKLEELYKQKKELEPKLKVLEIHVHNESIDVDTLERRTLTSVFYDIIGKKEEKLEQERAEAYSFIVKRDNVKRELEDIYNEINACESELSALQNCEAEYQLALDEKIDFINKTGKKDVDSLLVLEEKISYCDNQLKEINEVIAIVESAKVMANEVLGELDAAEGWGELDIFVGGILVDVKKHDHIDNAEALVYKLKKELSKIKSEIADVNMNVDVSIEEFSSFSDFFFDNIFTASNVLSQIESSKESMKNTIEQLKNIMTNLSNLKDKVISERTKFQIEYEGLR